MMCVNPFVSAGLAFGCGQCMPCRFNRRRIWATRLMVEGRQYADNAFVTLTYAPEKQPVSLMPGDMQLFMKRLRERYRLYQEKLGVKEVKKIRFFGVGEYGDQNGKAHFHYMLFNFPTCIYRRSRYSGSKLSRGVRNCCVWCDMVRDAWGKGFVYLGELEDDSAGYISGYVTKKMTNKDDPRLEGRHPEFARMSLKPGIGRDAMIAVRDTLLNIQNTLDTLTDVPGEIAIGREKRPLGRYLHKTLRKMVGRDEKTPLVIQLARQAEVQAVQMVDVPSKKKPGTSIKVYALDGRRRLIERGNTRRRSAEVKRSAFRKERML